MISLDIILYGVIGASVLGLGFIIYRKIPKLAKLSDEEIAILQRKKGTLSRLKEFDYKSHWINIMVGLEKFLRKINIYFLKVENILAKVIKGLRNRSQIATQKSRIWLKQKEQKRKKDQDNKAEETSEEILIKIHSREEKPERVAKPEPVAMPELTVIEPEPVDEDELSLEELKKPIKEEQKWIDLIVENPKNITAYKFLGLLYWRQHNYTDAKSSLEMAVKLGSKDKKVKEILQELKNMKID